MLELEARVLNINPEKIRKKLLDLGALKVKNGREDTFLLDYADLSLRKDGAKIRLRTFEGKSTLTYKKRLKRKKIKVSEEIETIVESAEDTLSILKKTGFIVRRHYEKDRESYLYNDILFELDAYPLIPVYLEIEALTEAKVKEGLKLLGITLDRVCELTLTEIHAMYGISIPNEYLFVRKDI